jgi:C-terminal processing protease CtpA/Prc
MLFAANSEALIIDLRDIMGGSPQAASMLAGFFMKEPTLININETRRTGVKQETWSAETDVTINSTNQNISTSDLEKLKTIPVYILTSDYTFSIAEIFSSSLQGHNRATVVGETTGRGGHGIRPFKIPEGFTAFIPFNRHYHPITKKG